MPSFGNGLPSAPSSTSRIDSVPVVITLYAVSCAVKYATVPLASMAMQQTIVAISPILFLIAFLQFSILSIYARLPSADCVLPDADHARRFGFGRGVPKRSA